MEFENRMKRVKRKQNCPLRKRVLYSFFFFALKSMVSYLNFISSFQFSKKQTSLCEKSVAIPLKNLFESSGRSPIEIILAHHWSLQPRKRSVSRFSVLPLIHSRIPLRSYFITILNKPTWSLCLSLRTVFPDCKSSRSRLILTHYIFHWQNIYIKKKYINIQ